MKNTFILFFIFLVFLTSCKSKKTEESVFVENEIEVIKPNKNIEPFDISPILDSVKFVKLELTENSIIGEITKVLLFEDRIYILDKISRSIFIFNIDGKFISKIYRVGRGPGEYTQLDFFDINYESSQIVLTDLMTYRILCYDLDGKFISDRKIPIWVEGVTPSSNNGFVVYANYRDNRSKLHPEYNILYLDSAMNVFKGYFQYNSKKFYDNKIRFSTPEAGNFYTYKQNKYFFSNYKSRIYQITNEGLKPKYLIDFGDDSFDEKFLSKQSELKDYIEQGSFNQLFSVFENDDFVSCAFLENTTPIFHCLFYSKLSKKIIESMMFTVGEDYFSTNNISTYESWFVSKIAPKDLKPWAEYIDEEKISLDTEYSILKKKLADEITLDDNEVLMFYKLKQF